VLGSSCKIVLPQQAKLTNTYKNTRLKLLKTNAAIWFNKQYQTKGYTPNYIHITISGNRLQIYSSFYIYLRCIFYSNFSFHDVAHVLQFHQNYIGFPEDGAHNVPTHVGARLYNNIWLFECILLVFLSSLVTYVCVKEIKCWCVVLLQLRWQTFLWWAQVGCSMEICGICRCIGMVLQSLSTASKSYLDHMMSQVDFLVVVCRLHCNLGIMSRGEQILGGDHCDEYILYDGI
jgi:hypothetical protein